MSVILVLLMHLLHYSPKEMLLMALFLLVYPSFLLLQTRVLMQSLDVHKGGFLLLFFILRQSECKPIAS